MTAITRSDLDHGLIEFVAWDAPEDIDTTGYSLEYYFDADGEYIGTDGCEVEPLFRYWSPVYQQWCQDIGSLLTKEDLPATAV